MVLFIHIFDALIIVLVGLYRWTRKINFLQLIVLCYFLYIHVIHSLFLCDRFIFKGFREVLEVKHHDGFVTECSNSRDWWCRQWDDHLSSQWLGSNNYCGRSKAELEPGHQLYPEKFGPSSPALPYCLFLQCCLSASSSPTPVPFCNPICCN